MEKTALQAFEDDLAGYKKMLTEHEWEGVMPTEEEIPTARSWYGLGYSRASSNNAHLLSLLTRAHERLNYHDWQQTDTELIAEIGEVIKK